MSPREALQSKKKIVIKVGSSTLSFPNGRINLQWMESLSGVLSELQSTGKKVVLVSSGALAVGGGILGLNKKPDGLADKQATASIGQSELIKIYQKFFKAKHQTVAQVLLTKDGLQDSLKRQNAGNTLNELIKMGIVPIINENDTVSTHGIRFGNNDLLSAYVAELIEADLLIILSDIDGLYPADPKKEPGSRIIPLVNEITGDLIKLGKGSGSTFGTGGMKVKLDAANLCLEAGIDLVIANGKTPKIIHSILAGESIGTLFAAPLSP